VIKSDHDDPAKYVPETVLSHLTSARLAFEKKKYNNVFVRLWLVTKLTE